MNTTTAARFAINAPALPIIPPFLAAMTPALVPLGSSNILVPPQMIYQLAYEAALRQLAHDRAQQYFRECQTPSNN